METTFIYGLFDPRNLELKYIGKADNPEARLKSHIYESQNNIGYNPAKESWINCLLAEGLQPSIEILEECSKDIWQEVERTWILGAKIDGLNLTNIAKGGEGGAIKFGPHPPEVIAKIKASKQDIGELTRKRLSDSVKKSWTKRKEAGKGETGNEVKEKISKALKGRKKSPETIEKMRIAQQHRRQEQKESGIIIKSPLIGKTLSEITKAKISKSLTGKKLSEDTKRKLSKIHKGRPTWSKGKKLPDETKRKMSESHKKKWAERRSNESN